MNDREQHLEHLRHELSLLDQKRSALATQIQRLQTERDRGTISKSENRVDLHSPETAKILVGAAGWQCEPFLRSGYPIQTSFFTAMRTCSPDGSQLGYRHRERWLCKPVSIQRIRFWGGSAHSISVSFPAVLISWGCGKVSPLASL